MSQTVTQYVYTCISYVLYVVVVHVMLTWMRGHIARNVLRRYQLNYEEDSRNKPNKVYNHTIIIHHEQLYRSIELYEIDSFRKIIMVHNFLVCKMFLVVTRFLTVDLLLYNMLY